MIISFVVVKEIQTSYLFETECCTNTTTFEKMLGNLCDKMRETHKGGNESEYFNYYNMSTFLINENNNLPNNKPLNCTKFNQNRCFRWMTCQKNEGVFCNNLKPHFCGKQAVRCRY